MPWRGETEDGVGWGGLVPTRAEREQEREQEREEAQRKRQLEVLRAERDHARARAQFEHAVRLLTGIHALLYPAPLKLEDGRTSVFRQTDPNPHEILQALSDRIRALPDELARAKHSPQGSDPWALHP